MYTEEITKSMSLQDWYAPVSTGVSTVTTTGFRIGGSTTPPATQFKRLFWVVMIGSVGGAGTLTATIQSAVASGFGTPHNVTGGVSNAIAASGLLTLEVRADQIQQQNNGDSFARLSIAIAGNAVVFGVAGFGCDAVAKPAFLCDVSASVQQRLIVP